MWELTIDEDVWDKLEKIPNPHKQRIQKSILALESGPDFLDIKKLVGRKGYRLRVGKWRLLMDIDKAEQFIHIYKLASRGEAYKD